MIRCHVVGRLLGLLMIGLGLAGCSTPAWLCVSPPGPDTVTLITAPDANGHTAVAVDLVFISDDLASQQISGLAANDYFARRAQLQRDFAAGMKIHSWELAPGQIERNAQTHPTCNRVKTLLFARYITPGDHRQVLGSARAIVITLENADFSVSP